MPPKKRVKKASPKRKVLKNKKTSIKQTGGNIGGSEVDYWRMHVPGGTGTKGNFPTLLDDIVAVVASSINTIVDTVHFVDNVMSLKGDMGTEFNNHGAPGVH